MSDFMSFPKVSHTNDVLRRAVRAEVECGRNWMGATSTVAEFLGVSPKTVRLRYRDEVTGAPRRKKNLEQKCWAFLDLVASRQRAWLARLEAEIATKRAADAESDMGPAHDSLERAQDAMADYDEARKGLKHV